MLLRFATLIVIGFAAASAANGAAAEERFKAARAIWPSGRSREMNVQAGFRCVFHSGRPSGIKLRLTASTLYRASVNGQFAGYGPARGPQGWFRIDEIDISRMLVPGDNVVAVEVAGYNSNSYYTTDQPSFLQAELVQGHTVLAATGRGKEWEAIVNGERLQKVQRYSFQRPFGEVYRIRTDHDEWMRSPAVKSEIVNCDVDSSPRRYLPRVSPYPDFRLNTKAVPIASGAATQGPMPPRPWKDRSLTGIGPKLKGYRESDLEVTPSLAMQRINYSRDAVLPVNPLQVGSGRFSTFDFGLNDTGFLLATVECTEPTILVFSFDEVLHDDDVDFTRLGCVNLIQYELPPGKYSLQSFEPYTFRYLKATVLKGACTLSNVAIREYGCSESDRATFSSSDKRLEKLFEAGRETFRQNAVDVFTDCPSRERAGWLCDSFFTARVAPDLTGNFSVERAMMQNFLLPAKFDFLPAGMLPMCYPADHNDGVFIANWALWFVVQLDEYVMRTGDNKTADLLKPRVMALFDWFKRLENTDGLLEKAPGWVFIEWSDANRYVQDVNYPSNMLYAGAMAAAARLYRDGGLAAASERIRETIRKQAFDGTFFLDNAMRKPDGKLEVTRNHTEVCQYYAFFFGIAKPATHPKLWTLLRDKFGPLRYKENAFPSVGLANSFIGNMLRVELLSREGLSRQILSESVDYLLYMADRTGTLWENVSDTASCNHGFASHIVHTLYRDVLGAREIDRARKRLKIRLPDVPLDWCKGTIPTPNGNIALSWSKANGAISYSCSVPKCYAVEVENASGLPLSKQN